MSEIPVAGLIGLTEAIRVIDAASVLPRVEQVTLAFALGRRLAHPIIADRDDPPFDKSQMDGYAVRAGNGPTLAVIGDIPAGANSSREIAPGQAMSIMTGAPIPSGADAVVPVEKTERSGDVVRVPTDVRAGQSVARRGSDCAAGKVVLAAGQLMNAAQIAVAASVGATRVSVFARPTVAVIGTGNEIVPADASPGPFSIRNSNGPMLAALLTTLGCDVVDLGVVVDEPIAIRQRIASALLNYDVLFVTGGMSMGTYDYVPRVLDELGFERRISKLRIKPGKPFVFAAREKKFVFGLPGNPVSGFVCTLRLASRLLARIGGGMPAESWMLGKTDVGLPANGPREFYQPVTVISAAATGRSAQTQFPIVRPLAWKASSDVYTLSAADGLLVRGENEPPLPVGTVVNVLMIPGR